MSSAPRTWLVTREAAEARTWVARLEHDGVRARALACIERRRLRFPAWPPRSAEGAPLLFLTSPFAAACVPWGRLVGQGVGVAALEPKTADVLRRQGLPVTVTAEGGAVALAHAVAAWRREAGVGALDVLYPTSDAGVGEAEQQRARAVLAKLGRVEGPVVYETVAPAGLAKKVSALPKAPLGLVFASPSAVRNFQAARRQARAKPAIERVVCLGRSTARAWDEARLQAWPRATCVASAEAVFTAVTTAPDGAPKERER